MTELAVELSDLRGYAGLVRRAADDCTAMGARSAIDIPDGDFGRMLELATYDYDALLPAFHGVLDEDGRRLDGMATTLRAVAGDFAETDHAVALSFGSRPPFPHDCASAHFGDVAPVTLRHLTTPPLHLPVLHLGFPFDQVCALLVRLGVTDPRELLLRFLVGDMTKAMTQAAYWDMYATDVDHVRANLAHGAALVRDTWEGRAADRADAAIGQWLVALDAQSQGMRDLGDHLRGMVHEAIEVARLIVDAVRFFVSTIAAGWACANLPIYGEIKLVNKIREAWHLIVDAKRVLTMFWGFLRVIGDFLRGAVDGFSVAHLPSAPALPGGEGR